MTCATVNSTRLYYEDHGNGRPLVFLHGWGTSGRVWDAQAADLMADHRVITVDWRGCGRSDRPATGYTIAQVTHDILEFLDALALDEPVLIGSSIAGAFTIEAALAAPDKIGAIVPVDAGIHYFSGMQNAMEKLLADLRADRAGTLADVVPRWYRSGAGAAMIDWTIRQLLDSTFLIDQLLVDQANYDPRAAWGGCACPPLSCTANWTPRYRSAFPVSAQA